MSVGMPQSLYLSQFGKHLLHAFDNAGVYLVGSALENKYGWRDVDVRVILDDETWDKMKLGDPEKTHQNGKWVSFSLAFSILGKSMTGLPIDFQLQQQTFANKCFEGPRSALGLSLPKYNE